MNERFRADTDLLLSGLTWKREDAQRVLSAAKGEQTPMKKKLSVSFALILGLVLITTAAALAIGYTQSQQYTDMVAARSALMDRYSLTTDMIALFDTKTEEANGVTTVTFTASGSSFSNPEAIGIYTAVLDSSGNATVSWSHDGADPASWADAGLTSPVWGVPQLAQMLSRYTAYTQWWADHDRADVYALPAAQRKALFDELRALVAPLELAEIPGDEPAQTAAPAATPVVSFSFDVASGIARQALYDHYALTGDMLSLFTEVQSLDMQDGGPVHTVAYLPVTAANSKLADWRWIDTLSEKLGVYIVQIDAASGTVLDLTWSLEGKGAETFAKTNWADAPAYSADILPDVLSLLRQNEAIILKYPEDQREWFSVEDAAAYDQAFRDAGFDAAAYNHALPRDTDVTARNAVELARAAMADGYALTDEQLDKFEITVEYVLDGGGSWQIGFYGSDGMGYVTLNAATGEIQMVSLVSGAASNG